ncbi:MAG TPA: anti-sigma factor, partial [Pyrinomonadaceae bacterium]|nr:anti-sigma factor [Pyrinomonadaceae bacterium]
MRHEEYKELVAMEAAGALEAGERERLEAHLPSCEECRAELRELSDAAASLAYTVAPVVPPKAVRARVLQSVRAVDPSEARSRAVDPSEFAARAVDPSGLKGTRAVDPSESKGTDLRGLLRRFSLWQILGARPSLAFGTAVALAAVAALGITTVALLNRNSALAREVSQLYDRLRDAQTETTGVRTQLASARDLNEILASPDARVTQLAGKGEGARARATLAYERTTGRALILTSGLPPAPAGKAYQLWLIADNKKMPGGTFKTDAGGRARVSDRLPAGEANPT